MPAPSPRARRGVGGVLVDTGPLRRQPGFRRLWTGQLIASLGSQLTVVAVAYQTYRLTGSTAMVGLVSLSGLVPLLAGSVLGGPAVDAWDRRKVMLATQVLLAVGAAGLAVNAMLAHPLLWPMFVCTAESAAFQSVDWAARRASLRQLVPPAEIAAAVSVQSAGFQASLVIGPAAAGLLIAQAGFALVYWLNVASFALAFITVARLPALRPDTSFSYDFAEPIFRLGNDYSKGIILSTGYVGQRTSNGLVTCLTDGHPGVSGGGILDQRGDLVGIPIGRMQGDYRFSFILPLRAEMFRKIPAPQTTD